MDFYEHLYHRNVSLHYNVYVSTKMYRWECTQYKRENKAKHFSFYFSSFHTTFGYQLGRRKREMIIGTMVHIMLMPLFAFTLPMILFLLRRQQTNLCYYFCRASLCVIKDKCTLRTHWCFIIDASTQITTVNLSTSFPPNYFQAKANLNEVFF